MFLQQGSNRELPDSWLPPGAPRARQVTTPGQEQNVFFLTLSARLDAALSLRGCPVTLCGLLEAAWNDSRLGRPPGAATALTTAISSAAHPRRLAFDGGGEAGKKINRAGRSDSLRSSPSYDLA
ncbi:unnamed protein product [Lampetra fluviatilis]